MSFLTKDQLHDLTPLMIRLSGTMADLGEQLGEQDCPAYIELSMLLIALSDKLTDGATTGYIADRLLNSILEEDT